MTNIEKYKYWEMLADYDLETAEAMLREERWMYVATVCHWSIQRLIKGMIVYHTKKEAPKSDNISFLLGRLAANPEFALTEKGKRLAKESDETYMDLIFDVMFYHISDYPFTYQKIMDRFIDEKTAREVYDKSVRIVKWLKSFQTE